MKITSTLDIQKPLLEVWELMHLEEYKVIDENYLFDEDKPKPLSLIKSCNLLSSKIDTSHLRKRIVKAWQRGQVYCKENLCLVNLGEHTRVICTMEVHFESWLMSYFDFLYLDKYHAEHDKRVKELKSRFELNM